jgi:hypothetical protein
MCARYAWLHEQRRHRLPALIRRLLLRCPQCCRVLPRNLRCRGTGRSTISEHGGGATGEEQWTRRGYGLLRRLRGGFVAHHQRRHSHAARDALRSKVPTNNRGAAAGAPWAASCPVPSLLLMASTSGDSDSGMWRRVCRRGRLALPRRVALHAGCFFDSRLPKTESRPHTRQQDLGTVRRGCPLAGCRPASPAGDSDPGPQAAFQRPRAGRGFGPLAGPGVQANGTWAVGCAVKGRRSLTWGESGRLRSLRITGGSCHGGAPGNPPILQPPPNPVKGWCDS